MNVLEQWAAKAALENQKAEAKRPAPTKEQVAKEADFLKKWAKGKLIRRVDEGSTFWQCGKYMTKIDYKMADALAKAGLASLVGNSREAGATLKML